jgi:hypothetical protein
MSVLQVTYWGLKTLAFWNGGDSTGRVKWNNQTTQRHNTEDRNENPKPHTTSS